MYMYITYIAYTCGSCYQFKLKNMFVYVLTGLIIDAFGELRDQLEQVKEDLEVSGSWMKQTN